MQSFLRDLGLWFWRLIPANPILVRVVLAGGRRVTHAWIRGLYLAVLGVGVVAGVIFAQSSGEASLAELAKAATQVFMVLSYLQLGLVCMIAPIFTAAAITQEKNSQTYNILLSTPLTNGQIVFGSLLSRLYFVLVLLLAGVPLFCVLMVYGGVTGDKIALSIALSACTAALTGALAISISVIKIGTGRTIFSFYLAIAVYLIAVYSLSFWNRLIPPEASPTPGGNWVMSWLGAFHPFLSLAVVLGQTPAPEFGTVAHYGFPFNYWLAYPQYSYIVMTLLVSLLLVSASLFFVRRGIKQGEPTFWNRLFGMFGSRAAAEGAAERTRKPRHVWSNPVAWREASTRVAAGGGSLVRYTILGLGMAVAITVLVYYARGAITTAETRPWLYGIIEVELGVALFIATATAATSMTREKESNTLALLLSTPITSSQIIKGKIRGLVTFALPMLAVPYATLLLFALYDLRGVRSADFQPVVPWESLITLPLLFVAFTAMVCMIGLWYSIKNKKTLASVFTSVAIVILCGSIVSICGPASVSSSAHFAAALMPLSPVYAVFLAIDPEKALADGLSGGGLGGDDLTVCRTVAFVAAVAIALVYALVIKGMHNAMVRGFDMTIRKQTA